MTMLVAIAALGGASLVLSSFFFGTRVALMARQTRGIPELCMGLGLLLMGGIGYLCSSLANYATGLPDLARQILFVVSITTMATGQSLVTYFTWRVFRPNDAWARTIAIALMACFGLLYLAQFFTPGIAASVGNQIGPWSQGSTWVTALNLSWACWEAVRYWSQMRKRERLGLADPVVTNRVLLWSIIIGAAALIVMTTLVMRVVGIETSGPSGMITMALVVGPMGPLSATCMGLAFMPPDFYKRWITSRSISSRPSQAQGA